jgi:small ligand-binding sensory domain FIST
MTHAASGVGRHRDPVDAALEAGLMARPGSGAGGDVGNGEFAPVGGRNCFHTYTEVLVVFA